MALITCPECGKQISDKAHACPGCGYPISSATHTHQSEEPHTSQQQQAQPLHGQSPRQQPASAKPGICPCCGKESTSIKYYLTFPKIVSYVVVYTVWRKWELCCPECMRKKVLGSVMSFDQMIKGNIFWLFLQVPAAIITCIMSMQEGHSSSVIVDDDGHVSVK